MQWTRRLILKRISTWAIIVLGITIVVFSLVTYYGSHVGNYVITVHDADNRSKTKLYLAKTDDLDLASPLISLQGLSDQIDATKSVLPSAQEIVRGMGVNNDGIKNDTIKKLYSAFSFWAVNKDPSAIDYTYVFTLDQDAKKLYEILRIWIIESNTYDEILHESVYGYPEETEALEAVYRENLNNELEEYRYAFTPFSSNGSGGYSRTEVCRVGRPDFQPYAPVKYTIVIWMEGWDPQCTDAKTSAALKASMDFYPVDKT